MFKHLFVLSFTLLSITNTHAAGFDCKKAASFVEKAICSDTNLSSLDEKLNQAYRTAKKHDPKPQPLQEEQAKWLKTRNTCQDNACLEHAYTQRLAELTPTTLSNTQFAGEYERQPKNDKNPANFTIKSLGKNTISFEGTALWINDASIGAVNIGEVSITIEVTSKQFTYKDDNGCQLLVTLAKNAFDISGDEGNCGGMKVSFNGHYQKVK